MEIAFRKMFWGLIIATFSINFGIITIFPTFVGWIIVLSGLSGLIDEFSDKQFFTASCSVIALILLSLVEGVLSFSQDPSWLTGTAFLFYPVMMSIIELTAFHKIIEASADRFKVHNQVSNSFKFNRKDRLYLVLMGLSMILLTAALVVNDETLLFFGLISTLIPRVYILGVLSGLSKEKGDVKLEEAT